MAAACSWIARVGGAGIAVIADYRGVDAAFCWIAAVVGAAIVVITAYINSIT
jgi:hypothetical protein